MKISIIAAMDQKRGIGKDNKIPWHIREDLIRLKKLTIGSVVVLGRTSFESMLSYYQKSGKPTMTQRTHVVITRDSSYFVDPKYGFVAHSIEEAIDLAKQKEKEEIFIIGGEKIFAQTIGFADKLYLTIVEGNFEGDVFFPDYSEFKKVVFEEEHDNGEYKFKFLELEK